MEDDIRLIPDNTEEDNRKTGKIDSENLEEIFNDTEEQPLNEENIKFVNEQISRLEDHIREEESKERHPSEMVMGETISFNNEKPKDILASLEKKYSEYNEEEEEKELVSDSLFARNTFKGEYFVTCPQVDEKKLKDTIIELRNSLLQKVNTDDECASVGITGPGNKSGKTTVAIMLAMATATLKRTLLIDCSFATSDMHMYFNNGNKVGLRNVMLGQYDIHQIVLNTDIDNLKIVTSGNGIKSSEISSKKMLEAVEPLLSEYDVIIFDLGNIDLNPYVSETCGYLTGNIITIKKGSTKFKDLQNASKKIKKESGTVLGTVVL